MGSNKFDSVGYDHGYRAGSGNDGQGIGSAVGAAVHLAAPGSSNEDYHSSWDQGYEDAVKAQVAKDND